MDRREFLRSGAAAIGAAALGLKGVSVGGNHTKPKAKPPNIIFIMSDDQGWGDLSLNWPGTNVRLPELERIGRNGVRFAEFHTEPLCGPSRACVFTGQYSMENGMWRGPGSAKPGENNYRGIKRDVVMLPQLLQRAGYVTGIFGKWHLGEHEGERPNDRGFDEFYGFLKGSHTYRLTPSTPTFFHNRQQYCENAHSTDYITDKSLDFIRSQVRHKRPFFCYVSYNAVHGPLWREERKVSSAPKNWLDKAAARAIDFPRRDYVAILEHMDWNIGRLMELLEELKIEQETLVVFMSDNGALTMTGESAGKARYPGNNGPYRAGKGTVYQGGLKVPCLIQWKGTFDRGLVSADLVMHVDLFSTILDVAGLDIPKMNGKNPVWGISLVSHIVSGCKKPLPDRTMFFELMGRVGVRRGDDKLVSGQFSSTRGRWKEHVAELKSRHMEFYDLSNDVAESENLRHKRPEAYLRLRDETVKFFESINTE
ncbi:MAG: sulfatase-like hydrolase/transferase [Planctomycetota bacterium]